MSEKDIWDLIDKNLEKLEVLIQSAIAAKKVIADKTSTKEAVEEANSELITLMAKKEELVGVLSELREKLPEEEPLCLPKMS